ncbi:HAD family hydrolase [Piscirickettsia salmonis]|nr:HAD family hydrolase [Piscirickettsia salmonis]QHS28036.1 HAD family hydrolase [Piscirickettsia salmonis]
MLLSNALEKKVMKKLKLLVFDWDGTLENSLDNIYLCKKAIADKYNVTPPIREVVSRVLGMSFDSAMSICFPYVNKEQLETLKNEFQLSIQSDKFKSNLYVGAREIIATLKNKGLFLVIATSKSRSALSASMRVNEVDYLFDMTCCGEEFENKPKPKMLHHIMAKFNVNHDEVLMIGDTVTDVLFAKNADIKTICVTWGAQTKDVLNTAKPCKIVDSFKQLEGILETLC